MKAPLRRTSGNALAEFGPALVIFVCFVLVPLIDISFIPVRYFIASGVVNECAHRVSLAEKRSDAYAIANEGWWKDFLAKCGVGLHAEPVLKMVVCGKNEADRLNLAEHDHVPTNWLPDGDKGPCIYSMELVVDADIPPLFAGSAGLPGFTSPINLKICSRSNWENLGRDPENGSYFVNE